LRCQASGDATLGYAWSKKSNAGWGSAWSVSGDGGAFRGSSTVNENNATACTSFSIADDINSPSGKRIGPLRRDWWRIGHAQFLRDFDLSDGHRDLTWTTAVWTTEPRMDSACRPRGGADVLQFYFLGGGTNYRYNERDGT